MSWSVGTSGKSDEVAKVIEQQFTGMTPCPDPEEGIKQAAQAIIAKALAGNIPPVDVTVSAFGSQSTFYGTDGAPDKVTNALSISIQTT
jgi:hypothetical protein